MYNKLYEFYYGHFEGASSHDLHGHVEDTYGPYHHHHHHHRANRFHDHHNHFRRPHEHDNLNLLDYLANKAEKSNDRKSTKKDMLFDKLIGSDFLARNPLEDYHHFNHRHHHDDHHHPHFHHDPYYMSLKSKMNYFISHDISPPISLINELSRLNRIRNNVGLYPYYHDRPEFEFDYNPSFVKPLHSEYYDFEHHLNSAGPHHHYHYNEHPVYDEFGRQIVYTSGQLERFPPSSKILIY